MAARVARTASSEPSVANRIFAGKSLVSISLSMPRVPPLHANSFLPTRDDKQTRARAGIRRSFHGVHAARRETVATTAKPICLARLSGDIEMNSGGGAAQGTVESYVPARMDRLPWARWHWLVVLALGITWVLDGLEVTIVGNIAGRLTQPESGLNLTEAQVGLAAGIYIAGACTGSLFFSYLTDRYGRKRLFLITLAVYLIFSFLTAFSWDFWSFAFFRFMAGTGRGGNRQVRGQHHLTEVRPAARGSGT